MDSAGLDKIAKKYNDLPDEQREKIYNKLETMQSDYIKRSTSLIDKVEQYSESTAEKNVATHAGNMDSDKQDMLLRQIDQKMIANLNNTPEKAKEQIKKYMKYEYQNELSKEDEDAIDKTCDAYSNNTTINNANNRISKLLDAAENAKRIQNRLNVNW